jgi:hypothetical protein
MIQAEYIFLGGAIFQIIVLLPILLDNESIIPRETSIPTTAIWFIYGATYFSISFHLAAVANVIGGSLWTLVAIYRSRPTEQDIDYITDELFPGD